MSSIRKREWITKSGKRRVAWQVAFQDRLGKRRAKQFLTKAAAQKWLDSTNLEALQTEQATTFRDAAIAWLDRAEVEELELSTIANYRWAVESYLIPKIGDFTLDRGKRALKAQMLVNLRKELIAAKSAALARRVIGCAKMILLHALRSEMTDRDIAGAMKVTRSPRHRKRPVIASRAEVRKLVRTAGTRRSQRRYPLAPTRNRLLYGLMAETGIRPCEARALAWSEVHFEKLEIEILRDAKKNGKIGACKTTASYRKIPISPSIAAELKTWRASCPRSPFDLVFPTTSGRVIANRNINLNFENLQKLAGVTRPLVAEDGEPALTKKGKPIQIAKYTPYVLRHGAASWWIYQKVDLKRLTTWIGHASVQVTLDTYGHLIEDTAADQEMTKNLAADLWDEDRDDES